MSPSIVSAPKTIIQPFDGAGRRKLHENAHILYGNGKAIPTGKSFYPAIGVWSNKWNKYGRNLRKGFAEIPENICINDNVTIDLYFIFSQFKL